MTDRFIGEVRPYSGPYAGRSFVGFVYDTTSRRAETGNMAQDFAFADMTAARKSWDRAWSDLVALLAALNTGAGE